MVVVDVFDEIRARHEGRVMRLRNLPTPVRPAQPRRRWYQWRLRRADREVQVYHQHMLAGWWEAETDIIFGTDWRGEQAS